MFWSNPGCPSFNIPWCFTKYIVQITSQAQAITNLGCVSQYVVKYVVLLTQCILNGDFNAQQANDYCECSITVNVLNLSVLLLTVTGIWQLQSPYQNDLFLVLMVLNLRSIYLKNHMPRSHDVKSQWFCSNVVVSHSRLGWRDGSREKQL